MYIGIGGLILLIILLVILLQERRETRLRKNRRRSRIRPHDVCSSALMSLLRISSTLLETVR